MDEKNIKETDSAEEVVIEEEIEETVEELLPESEPKKYASDFCMFSIEELTTINILPLSVEDKYFDEDELRFKDSIKKALFDIVAQEFARLTAAQRDVIIRFFLMEQRIVDIEHNLGIGSQSVIDRRNRALDVLRARLSRNPIALDLYKKLVSDDFPLLKR
jgi:DNA-directed RNA polymerase specialized sigma subunit